MKKEMFIGDADVLRLVEVGNRKLVLNFIQRYVMFLKSNGTDDACRLAGCLWFAPHLLAGPSSKVTPRRRSIPLLNFP